MLARIPIAFAAGFVSFLAPCVLPLVPGYLSAVSAVEAGRLGERAVARRVLLASVPFVLGFSAVFVTLGALAGAAGGAIALGGGLTLEIAGLIVVVMGLAFMGLLPWTDRLLAPGLVTGARRRGSNALLGAAFGVCAAPCMGPVLASILVLAGDTSTVVEGSVLLAAYSAGLALPFLVAGVAFARAMKAFRWLRDRYRIVTAVSGATLVAIGLLLFFDRFWWLQVGIDRALRALGVGDA
ncbi:MAG: cytochrome c biogenesis protein CcdA [Actinomycetota bacterium]|nr:cytochrome c biogenesis protein CcdA [Actinomycetota bacterium]